MSNSTNDQGTGSGGRNPRSIAREFAIQFLYQCEAERLYYYSDSHIANFITDFQVPSDVTKHLRELSRGTLESLDALDRQIETVSLNWKISRMGVIDRNVLRLATYELLESVTPPKVVLNEAIELAKKYGSSESGAFVNGLLDKLATSIKAKKGDSSDA